MIQKSCPIALASFLLLGGIVFQPSKDVFANATHTELPALSSKVNQTSDTGQTPNFKDIYSNHIYYQELRFLTSKQIIKGFPDGLFREELPITRAQTAVMIGRALELNSEPRDTKFSDVNRKVIGSGYIDSVVENGIMNGYPDNTFRPYEPVTREEIAIFLDSAFDLADHRPENKFSDISPVMIAYHSILNVYDNGIVNGFPDDTFLPGKVVTRGELAVYLARAMEPSFRGAPSLFVESISGWEKGSEILEVDIDKEWIIKFNDKIDNRDPYENIYIERESDKQRYYLFPMVDHNDPKLVRPLFGPLYDFDETYTLNITKNVKSKFGLSLEEPFTLKFHTRKLEYDRKESIVQDGVKFHIQLDQFDAKVFINVTAINISDETIPYIGFDGCDRGVSSEVYTDYGDGKVTKGSKWYGGQICTQAIVNRTLSPGATIKIADLLYFPSQQNNGKSYVKVAFQKGTLGSLKPIEVSIPLQGNSD
jgi:hypothetical protein